jgi:hypothetical protein
MGLPVREFGHKVRNGNGRCQARDVKTLNACEITHEKIILPLVTFCPGMWAEPRTLLNRHFMKATNFGLAAEVLVPILQSL